MSRARLTAIDEAGHLAPLERPHAFRRLLRGSPDASGRLPDRRRIRPRRQELAGHLASAGRRITPLPALILLAAVAITVAAGCGSENEQSAGRSASARAAVSPSPDLASRVVEGDELLGLRLIGADRDQVQTDPEAFSARHQGLYPDPAAAVIAQRRDGFVAGTGKRFGPGQRQGLAESIAVQMRDAQGAAAEAKRQFNAAFAPCPGEPRCAKGIERFEVPRVAGAAAVEIRHKVDGEVMYTSAIVFTEGTFVYQVFAAGPRIDDRRHELIDAAQTVYARVR